MLRNRRGVRPIAGVDGHDVAAQASEAGYWDTTRPHAGAHGELAHGAPTAYEEQVDPRVPGVPPDPSALMPWMDDDLHVHRAGAVSAAEPTGIPGIDNAGKLHGKGFFLNAAQRGMLVNFVSLRIESAGREFSGALGDVVAAQLVENENEVPMFVNILFGVVAGTASLAIQQALKHLLGSAEAALTQAAIHGVQVRAEEMADVSASEIEAIVGAAVDASKERAKPSLVMATTATAQNEKANATSYLDQLSNQTGRFFQHMREDPPSHCSDGQMLGLLEAFDADRHTRGMYREQIEEKLRRYKTSTASKIGRATVEEGSEEGAARETRVASLAHPDGSKQLMYVGQDFAQVNRNEAGGLSIYNGPRALSLKDPSEDGHFTSAEMGPATHAAVPATRTMFLGWVEPDLVQTALDRHEAVWLAEPETYDLNAIMFGASDAPADNETRMQ